MQNNIQDPISWLITIIIAVIASYIKDLFKYLFSLCSQKYRNRRQRKKEENERWIEKIASDSTLLIIEFIRACALTIVTLISLVLYAIPYFSGKLTPISLLICIIGFMFFFSADQRQLTMVREAHGIYSKNKKNNK